jgi:transaldolase
MGAVGVRRRALCPQEPVSVGRPLGLDHARGGTVNGTERLQEIGQSLWLDNITRRLLIDGTLDRYVRELSVTGLTSNPTIFDRAIRDGGLYDDQIWRESGDGISGEALFFALALQDLAEAADLFRGVHESTGGVDGWVSLEVSPLLANDAAGTIAAVAQLHAQARCPNLFIKIPGTPAGLVAIEESIFAGIPVNVTLLFSAEQYLASARAYMRGIARRVKGGLDPEVASVASLFVSRWDAAVNDSAPPPLRNRLGIAVAERTYKAYRRLLASPDWQALAAAGARPQRLLWASTGTKDPGASDTLYVEALAAPGTISTIPEITLHALADHGRITDVMSLDRGDGEDILAEFRQRGVDDAKLADQLQRDGIASFVRAWQSLLQCISLKSVRITAAAIPVGGQSGIGDASRHGKRVGGSGWLN